ncbi:pyridoxal phosphate-dependent aminotransferase [Nanoarchaeota archaeon]
MAEKIPEMSPSMFIGIEGGISFGSGQPDLAPPKEVYEVIKNFKSFKYGLIQGEAPLREALGKKHNVSPDNVVVTNGASEALDMVMRSVVKPGEKILLTRPYYYSYPPMCDFIHAKPVYTDLKDGKIDLDDFQEKVEGAKLALVNSPANPTGSVQSTKVLKEIEKITKDSGTVLLFDEVYSALLYDGEHYTPKDEHVVVVNSFSKTFSLCGVRVGYMFTEIPMIKRMIEIKTHTSMNTNLLAQQMAIESLKLPSSFIDNQLNIWRERREIIYNGLVDLGFDLWKPEGAFYVLPKPPHNIEPKKLVWNLFNKYNVITYLGEWFGAPDRIRLSYALDVEKIEEGLKLIGKCVEELK